MPHCQLLIPDLFWREGWDASRDLALPALRALTARGQMQSTAGASPEAWLCDAWGVARQNDWPVAPLTLQLDGGQAGPYYWLRADPVHLHLQRDHVMLADSGTFAISQQEAVRYTEALNLHFCHDGLIFYPLHPARWYLRLEAVPGLRTAELGSAAGRDIRALLLDGVDALRWRGIFNEIQMLLHHHPDNEAREARGEPAINSVWLWGGGSLPHVAAHYASVLAGDALPLALALAAGSAHAALPPSAGMVAMQAGNNLIVLDQLRGAAQYGDLQGYRDQLAALERNWFAPLKAMLGKGALARLDIVALGTENAQSFTVRRNDLWKFWRRKQARQ